jgi:transposase
MSNQLKMAQVQSILALSGRGWSQRRIARELGVDRETVARYVGLSAANPAKVPTGSEGVATAGEDPNPAKLPTGSVEGLSAFVGKLLPAIVSVPLVKRRSDCDPWRTVIEERVALGLSAKRIHQDLVSEHQATVGYDSVRRFIQRLGASRPLPMRRLECAAGDEVQVDFGTGAPLVLADGQKRKTYVFRMVLSHSRKAYSESVFRQTTDEFLRCLENAFWFFGGCTKTIVLDNLRAAVAHPDWFDPELVPKLRAFAQHYGTVFLPTKPYMPRHKGKIERGIAYVKGNALKARSFSSLEEQNDFLEDWEANTADTRIHGTTKRQVGKMFVEVEKPSLLPLPRERFPMFQEAQRIVSRDGHVEVAKAYYSVPPEHLGLTVWVRWDTRLVRIFNQRFEQIAMHLRHEQGRFSTQAKHIAPEKISGLEHGASKLLADVSLIGPHTEKWSEAMLAARGIEGTRVLMGLRAQAKKHSCETIEKACEIALSYGEFRLRIVRKLMDRHAAKQLPLPWLEEHPLIRPLSDYGRVVRNAWQRDGDRAERLRTDHRDERCAHLSPCAASERGFLRHDKTESARPEQQHLGDEGHHRGAAENSPPWPEYPSFGCASAEPNSVSSGGVSVGTAAVPVPFSQECSHE